MVKTLYIIHGWTYTIEPWKTTIALLEQNGIKVNMLKVPGLTTPSKKVWNIKEYANWADQNIPNGSIALGHSNGGRILLNLLSKKSTKLKHLILLDSAGVYEYSKKRNFTRKLAKIGAPLKKNKFISKVFHKLLGANDYEHAPENMKKTLTNMIESDKNLSVDNISTPTTILWGENDTVTPPRQAKILHEKIKGSTLKFYPNWTHAPYISNPTELAKAICKILEKL